MSNRPASFRLSITSSWMGVLVLWAYGCCLCPQAFCQGMKVEVFYRGLLSTNTVEWAAFIEQQSLQGSAAPFDLKLSQMSSPIPAQIGAHFGAIMKLGRLPPSASSLKVRAVFEHPPMTRPDGQVLTSRDFEFTRSVDGRAVTLVLDTSLRETWHVVPGPWTLKAYVNQSLIFAQRFTLKATDAAILPPHISSIGPELLQAHASAVYRDLQAAHQAIEIPDATWRWLRPCLNQNWTGFLSAVDTEDDPRAHSLRRELLFLQQPGAEESLTMVKGWVRSLPENAVLLGGHDLGLAAYSLAARSAERSDVCVLDRRRLGDPTYRNYLRQSLLPEEAFPAEAGLASASLFNLGRMLADWGEQADRPLFLAGDRIPDGLHSLLKPGDPFLQIATEAVDPSSWADFDTESWGERLDAAPESPSPLLRFLLVHHLATGHRARLSHGLSGHPAALALPLRSVKRAAFGVYPSYLDLRSN